MVEVFLKVLNMSIAAGWLILAVVLFRLVLKKAPKWIVVLLWGIVALRLVVPFSLHSTLSLIPSAETFSAHNIQHEAPAIQSGIPAVDRVVNPILSETFAPPPGNSVNPFHVVIFLASVLWLLGMTAMLLYGLISYVRVHRSVAERMPYERSIYLCDHVKSPFILGLLRPRIYLPSGLDAGVMAAVVAHERAHLERRDHWWKPLGFLILAVHWFDPLCWIAYVLLCRDIELACDERVIRQMDLEGKKRYSAALLACSTQRRMVTICPLAFGELGIKERVKNVLRYKKPALWLVALAVAVCVVMTAGFATDPVSDRANSEERPAPVAATGSGEEDPYLAEARNYGFPFVLAQFTEDLDGDGNLDTVELLEDWYPMFNEQNEPSYDRWIWHRPAVRATVGEETFFLRWEEASYESTLTRIEDSSGRPVFVALFDLGGGSYSLYSLSCCGDNGFDLLPLLTFRTAYGRSFGLAAEAAYTDHYGVSVSVPKTGFRDTFYVPELCARDTLYDENGRCIDPGFPLTVQGLCGASPVEHQGKSAIQLVQPICEGSGSECLGYLVSVITWDGQSCIVLDQRVATAAG